MSDSISNYDFIGVEIAYATTVQSASNKGTFVWSIDNIKKMSIAPSQCIIGVVSVATMSGGTMYQYYRNLVYANDTQILFADAKAASTTTVVNNTVIPLQIIGYKY